MCVRALYYCIHLLALNAEPATATPYVLAVHFAIGVQA